MRIGKVDPFLRQSAGTTVFKMLEKRVLLYVRIGVYGSHDPDAADLRGHHDDLHGSNAVFKACRLLFSLDSLLNCRESLLARARLSFCGIIATEADQPPDSEVA